MSIAYVKLNTVTCTGGLRRAAPLLSASHVDHHCHTCSPPSSASGDGGGGGGGGRRYCYTLFSGKVAVQF